MNKYGEEQYYEGYHPLYPHGKEKVEEDSQMDAIDIMRIDYNKAVAEREQYMMINGLSKREFMAATAMEGILSSEYAQGWRPDEVCRVAFRHADEFLKQSQKPIEP